MPFGLTSGLKAAPLAVSMADFSASIKAIACGSLQTLATTAGIGVAVGVKTEVGATGVTGVSVGRKIKGGASGVGVGAATAGKLQPASRISPTVVISISLLFIAFSSL